MLRPNDIIGSDSLIRIPAMQISSKRKTRAPAGQPAYRSLEGWALGTLIEQHVTECEYHGHRRDQADPDAWNRARERLGVTRPRERRLRLVSPRWKKSYDRSAIAVPTVDPDSTSFVCRLH
jgi:hypothetical protein